EGGVVPPPRRWGEVMHIPIARWKYRTLSLFTAVLLGLSMAAAAAPKSKPADKPANDQCLACHGDPTLAKEVNGKPFSLFVNPDKFKDSIHGSILACVDCHTDLKTAPHD